MKDVKFQKLGEIRDLESMCDREEVRREVMNEVIWRLERYIASIFIILWGENMDNCAWMFRVNVQGMDYDIYFNYVKSVGIYVQIGEDLELLRSIHGQIYWDIVEYIFEHLNQIVEEGKKKERRYQRAYDKIISMIEIID